MDTSSSKPVPQDAGPLVIKDLPYKASEQKTCQVTVYKLDTNVSAEQLSDFIEKEIGFVTRCRLKTLGTPLYFVPAPIPTLGFINIVNPGQYTPPHAFLQFVRPEYAEHAKKLGVCSQLLMGEKLLRVKFGLDTPYHRHQRTRTSTPYKLTDVHVQLGCLVSKTEFSVDWDKQVDFLVDPWDGKCKFFFQERISFESDEEDDYAYMNCEFKMEFLARDIIKFIRYEDSSTAVVLLQLALSPSVYYRTADDDIVHSVSFDVLDDDDPWNRTTDFTQGFTIGKCNSYLISISHRHGSELKRVMRYLQEQNVSVEETQEKLSMLLERSDISPEILICSNPFFCIQKFGNLQFNTLYLLNAVLHKGLINMHQLCGSFYNTLMEQSTEVNEAALKYSYCYQQPFTEALKSFKKRLLNKSVRNSSMPLPNQMEIRKLVITPTRAYCLPPEPELSNRVLRHFTSCADRFLRVTFRDENLERLHEGAFKVWFGGGLPRDGRGHHTSVYRRIEKILFEGFTLCGRKYSFLTFSLSQLRDRSAWYVAETSEFTVEKIREWMGTFVNMSTGKTAARMGQCFSSTYGTVEVPTSRVQRIDDIERNGYTFSDGIGGISSGLAEEVADKLNLDEQPCAYQIRYGGYKGVVALRDAKDDKIQLYLRNSMLKFACNHKVLEICSWTKFLPAFLNRQIITLLSTLGVLDSKFLEMQKNIVKKLSGMHESRESALEVLKMSCSEKKCTAIIMLENGFKLEEPYLRQILHCVKSSLRVGLRTKARIPVPLGGLLIGCLDEYSVLNEGECYIQVSDSHSSKRTIVEELVAIAKNPCLHPGDIRILKAVNKPDLMNFVDCIVFPQKGARPHCDEASGSDLDGDLYFVTWDPNLIPPSKKSFPPMDYRPEKENICKPAQHMWHPSPESRREHDITELEVFFLKNMANNVLGAICNAHTAFADSSPLGAEDSKCIELAQLASVAVDCYKTGVDVSMPRALKPKQFPDFMGKEAFQSYKSTNILGKLAQEELLSEEFASSKLSWKEIRCDESLIVEGHKKFIPDALKLKCEYDCRLRMIMTEYGLREGELASGFIYSPQLEEDLKQTAKMKYERLKSEYRASFEQLDEDHINHDENKTMSESEKKTDELEKKASAWYAVTYINDSKEQAKDVDIEPLLSFAWIAGDYLGDLKSRCVSG